MKKFGIDISRWQGDFDFDKAVAEGVEFAIIKGGGGDDGLYIDSKFERNYKEAKAKGLPIGCYWFSKATSVIEAENEARYFYQEILQGKQFELPVYIDIEHSQMIGVGKQNLTDTIKAFCDYLESKGYFVGIYSSLSYFETYMNDVELQKYAHWVAQWSKECTYKGKEGVLGMWQFGGETNLIRTNQVAGVTCDQNYMLIDYPFVIKNAGLNGYQKTTSKPTESQKRQISVGDVVRMTKDGRVYGTLNKFADFVYNANLYVREINGNRVVVSIRQTGAVTGAVDIKYLQAV